MQIVYVFVEIRRGITRLENRFIYSSFNAGKDYLYWTNHRKVQTEWIGSNFRINSTIYLIFPEFSRVTLTEKKKERKK